MALQIYTIEDKTEVDQFVASAQEEICWYQPSPASFLNLIDQMESCWSKVRCKFFISLAVLIKRYMIMNLFCINHGQCDDMLVKLRSSLEHNFKDMDEKFGILRKRLSTDHAKIKHCLNGLGLICAHEV